MNTKTIDLTMPRGPVGRQTVDLSRLGPRARALAEAIAETPYFEIRLCATSPRVDMYHGTRDQVFAWFGSEAFRPMIIMWGGWAANPSPGTRSIEEILEYEATKIFGWYPVSYHSGDLPSSQAAAADDTITADQAVALVMSIMHGRGITGAGVPTKDRWMRNATRSLDGYPAPVRHNGTRSLWSAAAVRMFADNLQVVAR